MNFKHKEETEEFIKALEQIVNSDAIPEWMNKENPAFNNLTPNQVIENGHIHKLWEMIHAFNK